MRNFLFLIRAWGNKPVKFVLKGSVKPGYSSYRHANSYLAPIEAAAYYLEHIFAFGLTVPVQ